MGDLKKTLKKMYDDVLMYCNAHKKMYRAEGKRQVIFRSFRKRLLDHDNLVGGCKYLLDSLERVGLIVNDSEKYVEVSYFQQKCKHERTEIYLYDMEKQDANKQALDKERDSRQEALLHDE